MKRIGILTAGGDTPALNATVHGAVVRANQRRVEVFGSPRVDWVRVRVVDDGKRVRFEVNPGRQ